MSKAKKGDNVKVHYKGKLKSGEQFDSSEGREPLSFTVGAGQMIKGFDEAIPGMEPGEKKTISIAPENAVGLQVWWGHGLIINGKALKASGISDSDKDPIDGWYIRNSTNKINALQENAQAPVWFTLTNSEPDNLIKGMRAYSQLQLQNGITTVQYMGTGFKQKEASDILQKANISQRIRIIAWPLSTYNGRVLSEWKDDNTHPTSLTSISGIKYLIDGTPLEQNSLNKKPYSEGGTWYGHLEYPVDTIKQFLKEALTSNRQLIMHITGDSSMAIVLSLMKQLAGGDVWKSKRVRIEHNSTPYITPSEVNDAKELGLLMMHTPKYCKGSPIRSFIEKGITVGISPDGTTNPFWNIMVITSQQTNPAENITREQAVIAYTKTNAYAEFAEKEKGTLAKGMLADLAVLSQDIFTIPIEQLPATNIKAVNTKQKWILFFIFLYFVFNKIDPPIRLINKYYHSGF